MTPLGLTTWFRARMLPLVGATAVVLAASAPAAYYLRERWDLAQVARAQAARVAELADAEIDERPSLWRYDVQKLAERLQAERLQDVHVRLADATGPVTLPTAPVPAHPVWGRVERPRVTVWVAADQRPLMLSTINLAAAALALALVLGAVLYLLPVRAIARAERRIALLLGKLATTLQEEDRRRIARDLHDGAGQAITAARLELAALRARARDGDATIDRVTRHLDEALAEVRRSTTALAPPALAELGLARALERHCEAFADAAGLAVACEVAADLPALGAEVETACYRIVQEALTNTARHAGATRAWVRLAADGGRLLLEIGDDGAGLGDGAEAAGGRGIDNIRARARLLGGEVDLASQAGRGVRVAVTLPLGEP